MHNFVDSQYLLNPYIRRRTEFQQMVCALVKRSAGKTCVSCRIMSFFRFALSCIPDIRHDIELRNWRTIFKLLKQETGISHSFSITYYLQLVVMSIQSLSYIVMRNRRYTTAIFLTLFKDIRLGPSLTVGKYIYGLADLKSQSYCRRAGSNAGVESWTSRANRFHGLMGQTHDS